MLILQITISDLEDYILFITFINFYLIIDIYKV